MLKYTFWVTVLMIGLAAALVWAGKDGLASTIVSAILIYWLGKGNNGKPVKESNNSRGA